MAICCNQCDQPIDFESPLSTDGGLYTVNPMTFRSGYLCYFCLELLEEQALETPSHQFDVYQNRHDEYVTRFCDPM